jgi:hypothetical protein
MRTRVIRPLIDDGVMWKLSAIPYLNTLDLDQPAEAFASFA